MLTLGNTLTNDSHAFLRASDSYHTSNIPSPKPQTLRILYPVAATCFNAISTSEFFDKCPSHQALLPAKYCTFPSMLKRRPAGLAKLPGLPIGYLLGGCWEVEEITAADAARVRERRDASEYFILTSAVGTYQWHKTQE